MSGDEIRMADNAFIMIHNARGGVMGEATDMRRYADLLEAMNANIAAIYWVEERALEAFMSIEDLAERCGLNKTVIEKLTATGALDILPKKNQTDLFAF